VAQPGESNLMRPAFRALWPVVISAALGLLMFYFVGPAVGNFPTYVIMQVGIAVMLAVSLNIVNGFTGQFSIGHAGFLAIGGYVAATCTYYGGMVQWGSPGVHGGFLGSGEWLLVFGCLVGGSVAAVLGYLVGLPSLRLRGDYLAIVTLGFGEIVRVIFQRTGKQVFDKEELGGSAFKVWPPPLGGAQGFKELPVYTNLFWVWLFAALTIFIAYRLKTSSTGRAFLSIREDEIAARAMGIDIAKYKVRAFVIAAFLAGVAGGLYGHSGVNMAPADAGFQRSFEIIIMVVLGGMGSISGAVLAAMVLGALPELLRQPAELASSWPWGLAMVVVGLAGMKFLKSVHWLSTLLMFVFAAGCLALGLAVIGVFGKITGIDLSQYRMILYALLLILVMIFRPSGLFGVHEIWELFRTKAGSAPILEEVKA
jgi:branched-chain amino acid transport system permease protein